MRLHALIATFAVAALAVGCDDTTDSDASDVDGGGLPDIAAPDVETGAGTDGDVSELDGGPDTSDVDGELGDVSDAADGGEDADGESEPDCTSDDMCPGNAVCDMDTGNCRFYSVVQIRDVTRANSSSAQDACNDAAAGSDLFEIELQGAFGTPRGYARAVKAKLTASENTNASTVFDGSSNSLRRTPSGNLCPSAGFTSDSVLSLGCDGTMVAVFTNGAGDVRGLGSGQQIVVHEYGRQCCDGDCPKEYWEVRVCKAQSPQEFQNKMPDSDGNWPTCDTQILGVGSGRDSVTVRLPRP